MLMTPGIEAIIEKAGEEGFYAMYDLLKRKNKIRDPKKLAGWLKAKAREMGMLSPEHE